MKTFKQFVTEAADYNRSIDARIRHFIENTFSQRLLGDYTEVGYTTHFTETNKPIRVIYECPYYNKEHKADKLGIYYDRSEDVYLGHLIQGLIEAEDDHCCWLGNAKHKTHMSILDENIFRALIAPNHYAEIAKNKKAIEDKYGSDLEDI